MPTVYAWGLDVPRGHVASTRVDGIATSIPPRRCRSSRVSSCLAGASPGRLPQCRVKITPHQKLHPARRPAGCRGSSQHQGVRLGRDVLLAAEQRHHHHHTLGGHGRDDAAQALERAGGKHHLPAGLDRLAG
jgi:hypothetical protein